MLHNYIFTLTRQNNSICIKLQHLRTRLKDHLLAKAINGLWPYHSGGLPTSTDSSLESFMAAMKDRIEETATKHPRLSPYTLPVARKALHRAQHAGHFDHEHDGARMLNRSIMKELKNWQFSV